MNAPNLTIRKFTLNNYFHQVLALEGSMDGYPSCFTQILTEFTYKYTFLATFNDGFS